MVQIGGAAGVGRSVVGLARGCRAPQAYRYLCQVPDQALQALVFRAQFVLWQFPVSPARSPRLDRLDEYWLMAQPREVAIGAEPIPYLLHRHVFLVFPEPPVQFHVEQCRRPLHYQVLTTAQAPSSPDYNGNAVSLGPHSDGTGKFN